MHMLALRSCQSWLKCKWHQARQSVLCLQYHLSQPATLNTMGEWWWWQQWETSQTPIRTWKPFFIVIMTEFMVTGLKCPVSCKDHLRTTDLTGKCRKRKEDCCRIQTTVNNHVHGWDQVEAWILKDKNSHSKCPSKLSER